MSGGVSSVHGAIGVAVGLFAAVLATAPAQAALGGHYQSVQADGAHMSAKLHSTAVADHTVHALTLPNGGVTREFARTDGTVFAVAWRGPGRPDLRQLLGARFDDFQAVATARVRRGHSPVTIDHSDLLVRSSGHPGAFWGFAYDPQLAPAGFSIGDLK